MSRRKPNGLDPSAVDLTRPLGLLGMLVDHGEQCTPYVTRIPALIGALVGFSAATRNRFALRIGPRNHLPLNLFGAEVGDTGRGKETGLRLATAIAQCGGVEPAAFASAEGLHRALAAQPKDGSDPKARILILDEWGRALQQIKADKAGHQRGVMTKAMECYGLAIGGTLKERSYANAKNDVPAVTNPYLCALFATTPSTLLDALTSEEVLDGSVNRVLMTFLDDDPALRDLDDIQDVMITAELSEMIRCASNMEFEPDGERQPGGFMAPVKRRTFANLEHVDLGGRSFNVITVEPGAAAVLKEFRDEATQRARSDQQLGPLWSRAFENAARVAGVTAVGEACVNYGALVLSERTAQWAVAFTRHCVETTISLLRGNLADTDPERTRKRILQHAWNLSEAALADPDPTVENTAPIDKQDEIRDLKRAGWFPKSELIRRAHHKGCGSDKIGIELRGLVEAELMATQVVEWQSVSKRRERREFFLPLGSTE